jgi:hypothetical protein
MEKSGLDDVASFKRDPAPHENEENRREGNDPQPPDLEKQDGQNLSKNREVLPYVNTGQAGHAYGRGRGKKSIHKGKMTLSPRKWQPKKKSANKNHGGEPGDKDPFRR